MLENQGGYWGLGDGGGLWAREFRGLREARGLHKFFLFFKIFKIFQNFFIFQNFQNRRSLA